MVRYCKRCGGKTVFASSGLFRVNAQRKTLDVWLIFKCRNCETTWNLTVLSRVSPHSIAPDILRKFYENDEELAMRYAADVALIKRNGAEPGIPPVEILGEPVDLSESARIRLTAERPSAAKAAAAIRNKLGLSRKRFEEMCDSGKLVCTSGQDLKRCTLTGTILLEIR